MVAAFQLFTSLRYDPALVPISINIEAWDGPRTTGSPFYMLPYHRDRMQQAAEYFGWGTAVSRIKGPSGLDYVEEKLSSAIGAQSSKPLRIRVLLDEDGTITIEQTPVHAPASKDTLFPKTLPLPVLASESEDSTSTTLNSRAIQGAPEMDDQWILLVDPSQTNPSPETSYKTTCRDMYNDARQRTGIQTFSEKKEVLIVSSKNKEIMEGSLTTVYFWRNGKWTTPPISSGGQIGTTRRWALEKHLCVEDIVTADSLTDGEECWISNGVRGFNWGKIKLLAASS